MAETTKPVTVQAQVPVEDTGSDLIEQARKAKNARKPVLVAAVTAKLVDKVPDAGMYAAAENPVDASVQFDTSTGAPTSLIVGRDPNAVTSGDIAALGVDENGEPGPVAPYR